MSPHSQVLAFELQGKGLLRTANPNPGDLVAGPSSPSAWRACDRGLNSQFPVKKKEAEKGR